MQLVGRQNPLHLRCPEGPYDVDHEMLVWCYGTMDGVGRTRVLKAGGISEVGRICLLFRAYSLRAADKKSHWKNRGTSRLR